MDLQNQISEALTEAGFADVKIHKYVVPWGAWPKDKKLKKIGHTMAANLETGIDVSGSHTPMIFAFADYEICRRTALLC